MLVGLRIAAGAVATPVPLNAIVCGLSTELSVSVILPLRAPLAPGVNITLMVHVAFTARLLGQVFVCAKSLAFVPVTAILVKVSAVAPVLVTVTVCAPLA